MPIRYLLQNIFKYFFCSHIINKGEMKNMDCSYNFWLFCQAHFLIIDTKFEKQYYLNFNVKIVNIKKIVIYYLSK